jgi:TolA-binding protein
MLTLAQLDLATRDFERAHRRAEALLGTPAPDAVRAEALLVAADAAQAMRSYSLAIERYREFLSMNESAPGAPRVAMALGWAELRQEQRDGARRTWTDIARTFPDDPRAPLALLLAAEIASRAGDVQETRRLLDRLIADYPSSRYARLARMNRSILVLGEGREEEALADLRTVVESGQAAIADRRTLAEALAVPGAEARLEGPWLLPDLASAGVDLSSDDGPSAAVPERMPLERFAAALVATAGGSEAGARVLHGLVLLAAQDSDWSGRLPGSLVYRLVDAFPSYPAAPGLLARFAAATASARQWPIARDAYEKLAARYPAALGAAASVHLAEALFRTGATAEARARLEQAMTAARGDELDGRAWLLLAEVNEALDDRRAALAAYERLRRDHPDVDRTIPSLLSHARLLQDFGHREDARPLLETVVERAEGVVLAEASYRLADVLSAEGRHAAAVEWFMTAAYSSDGSTWRAPALLGAGRSLTAVGETEQALIVYRKLLESLGRTRDGDGVPAASSPDGMAPHDRETTGEAAYRIAEILRGAGRSDKALDMYLTAARLSPGSPRERRALLGLVQSFVAVGDRPSAEIVYRRLLESSATEAEILAEARKALGDGVPAPRR